ncbi:MAG TPA: type II secretion system protein M [Burkholderiaceae bacterium]|nr:type II secretion system protein M [Burkholderiaceae bacterium]
MNALQRLRQSLLLFLAARDRRERILLGWGTALLVLALVYMLLIDPALAGRAQLRKNLPALHQQVAELQALASEATGLSGKTAAPLVAVSKESIETSLARSGLAAQSVVVTGDFIKVQLAAASFAGIVGWLGEMQASTRVAVSDAAITALSEPGSVNATLTLQRRQGE